MLTNLRRNIAAAITGRAAAPAAAPRPPAVVPLGLKAPRTLNARDLKQGAQVIGAASVVAYHMVPRGDVFEIDTGRPLRMYVRARIPYSGTTTAGGLLALDLDTLAPGMVSVRSTRPAPAVPFTTGHPDVLAVDADGDPVSISVLDLEAGTLTLSGLAESTAVTGAVYALLGVGEFSLRASQPSGVDQRSVELFNGTFRGLHETDQSDGRTAPRIERAGLAGLPLGPKWRLELVARAPALIEWLPHSGNELVIHGNRAPVAAVDERALGAALNNTLRNG